MSSLRQRILGLREKYEAEETKRKEERKRGKSERDYEIYAEMPYKLSKRRYTLGERHPVSKRRFDAAIDILNSKDEAACEN